MANEDNPKATKSSRNEIQPLNRQTPSVRLNLTLGQFLKRKSLGDPYKRK